jgi:NTE family protein
MRKLKIGLALGAGAARGWSHIGVINALQRMVLKLISSQVFNRFAGRGRVCLQSASGLEKWVCSFSNWDVLR